MNRYPMQRQAQQLQAQGRYGDSVLVHMNPAEVAGIASLTPGGLTRNPQTGQPEAFAFLIPMLASFGASSAASAGLLGATLGGTGAISAGLGSALAGGIASGVSTAALTGDLKRGLVSGVTGAALGAAAGTPAVGAEAASGITQAMPNAGNVSAAFGDAALQEAASSTANTALTTATAVPSGLAGVDKNVITGAMSATNPYASLNPNPVNAAAVASQTPSFTGAMAQNAKNLGSNIFRPQYMIPTYMGLGTEAQMAADQEMKDFMGRRQAEKEEKKKKSRSMLSRIYGGYSDGGIVRMQGGGTTPDPYTPEWYTWLQQMGLGAYGTILGPAGSGYRTPTDPWSNDPIALQRRQHWYDRHLRDAPYETVKPPSDYVPGFNPEFPYFQAKGVSQAGNQPYIPEYQSGPYGWMQQYQQPYSSPINRAVYTNRYPDTGGWPTFWPETYKAPQQSYFNSIVPQAGGGKGGKGGQQQQQPDYSNVLSVMNPILGMLGRNQQQPQEGMAAGGPAPQPPMMEQPMAQPPMMEQPMAQPPMMQQPMGPPPAMQQPMGPPPGGIASVPGAQPPGQGPSPQELEMVAMAIAGMAGEQGQQIIDMFIQKYGPDVFRKVREMVLQMVQPGAQTQGMIKGQGGGMDDQVMGSIGAQQPVAVSPGEYIVPADVVSGLGDGSSDAGAQELDRMSQDVRMARGGSAQQPPAIEARRYMPR